MGIDPVTHEPLHKETDKTPESDSSATNQSPETEEKPQENLTTTTDETSYSPTDQNSSSDESHCNLYENDPLISCLFRDDDDPPLVDFPWQFPPTEENMAGFSASSWDQSCQWLLDCQDFGLHDFGFEDIMIEGNSLETDPLETGKI